MYIIVPDVKICFVTSAMFIMNNLAYVLVAVETFPCLRSLSPSFTFCLIFPVSKADLDIDEFGRVDVCCESETDTLGLRLLSALTEFLTLTFDSLVD